MIKRTRLWCAWKNKYKVLKKIKIKKNKNKVQNSKLCSICSCPFSWNYFSPQWYRTHTAQWDIQSIFRSPSSQREEERTKKFLSTLHHWFWSPAKAFTCRIPTLTFLLLRPITKIIVSSTLSKLKWKEGKAKWCRHQSQGSDSKRGTR